MKFYGLEIGCTKLIPAEKGYEVIAITTFGEDITSVLNSALRPYSNKVIHEGEYEDIPKRSPEVSRVRSLDEEKKWRSHHTYHYKVADYLLQSFLNNLSLKIPSNSYIKLDNK